MWGRGYATEAALAAVAFAFEELDRPEVISIAHPENAASRRVMEKAGLTYAGATPLGGAGDRRGLVLARTGGLLRHPA